MKFFWAILAILFIKPIIGIVKFFWMIKLPAKLKS